MKKKTVRSIKVIKTSLSLVATVGVNSLAQAFLHDQVVAFQAGRQEEGVPDDDDGNMLLMKMRMIMVVVVLQQGCTNRCSLAARLRGNEERMRK